jgi:mannose-6-phosphate isomerase-like protein (cupin superfamily)
LVGKHRKKVLWRISLDNIRIIKTGINVSKILQQLKENSGDWGAQKKIEGIHNVHDDHGFPDVDAGVLQLVIGGISKQGEYVGDTELCKPTDAFYKHTHIVSFLKRHFHTFRRCGFLSLPIGGEVGTHIDVGNYYQTKDRYHLSIQGRYIYTVGEESVTVEPGTLLWFNNKLPHGTKNIGDCVRVTFVFDVPHHKSNP